MATRTSRMHAKAPPPRDALAHGEWLIDEAIMETFPASDPAAPYLPEHGARPRERAGAPIAGIATIAAGSARDVRPRALPLALAGIALFAAGYVAGRARR